MKNVILIVLLGLVATSASAQIFNPNQEGRRTFDVPVQPPEMRPGYALEGKGLHSAVPSGQPGVDCIVNPVSPTIAFIEVIKTKLVAGTIVEIPVNILFDFDGDVVRPKGREALLGFYEALVANGVETITVTGHTDSKGTDEYNFALGLRRSAAVSLALIAAGFNAGNLEIASAGESQPKVPNELTDGTDDPIGRQSNRRVDILIVSVYEQEIEFAQVVETKKNPQIFHVLGSGNSVVCHGGIQPTIGISVGGNTIRNNGGIVIAVPVN